MRDINWIYTRLSPEQLKAMEGVLEKRQLTLESFKLMRKDYSRIKTKVKAIEKKLHKLMNHADSNDFAFYSINSNVASIENKYKDIELAIRHYNMAMKRFNDTINFYQFPSFNADMINAYQEHPVNMLKSYLSLADLRIANAMDAMRITQRYFKNVASAFKGHARLMHSKKQMQARLKANELKLLKESGQQDVSPAPITE